MCVRCDLDAAISTGDWDEVIRLAEEQKKIAEEEQETPS